MVREGSEKKERKGKVRMRREKEEEERRGKKRGEKRPKCFQVFI